MCTGFDLPGPALLEEARVSAMPAFDSQIQVFKRSKSSMRSSLAKRRLSKMASRNDQRDATCFRTPTMSSNQTRPSLKPGAMVV